jgi:hypothetical protein
MSDEHGDLRWLIREDPRDPGSGHTVTVLQRCHRERWGSDEGPPEWRDVPVVDEREL